MFGCKDSLFDDQAHSLQYCWKNLHDLQSIAISGVFGREKGVLTPFDNLRVDKLRTELQARGVEDTSMKKGVLRDMLDNILRGVMRVPALLLTDPIQLLTCLNLHNYEVVAPSLSLADNGAAGVISPPLTQGGTPSLSLADNGAAGVVSPPLTQGGAHSLSLADNLTQGGAPSLSLADNGMAGVISPPLTQDGAHSLSGQQPHSK